MKIIDPSIEIITEQNPLKRIELCGRVCYKSEDKITPESARGFVERIIKSGHTSVLEHARVKVPWGYYSNLAKTETPYGFHYRKSIYCNDRDGDFFQINARDFLALGGTLEELTTLENADDYMTARFICDRAIANELVRHRVFSFSQESTRYVNYKDGIEFIRPLPFEWAIKPTLQEDVYHIWLGSCNQGEIKYRAMVEAGCSPQEARSVLPLSTKTELIMTGTHDQWSAMLKLRMDKAAHPQMRYLMNLLTEASSFPKDKIKLPKELQ